MDRKDYNVVYVCALPVEVETCRLSLDEEHDAIELSPESTRKIYICGRIGSQNVVIASLPLGSHGTLSAATVAAQVEHDFPSIESRLLIGVAGGVPDLQSSSPQDIRLGDVVVSTPTKNHPSVVTHDSGKILQTKRGDIFERKNTTNQPPKELLAIATVLRSQSGLQQRMAAHVSQIIAASGERTTISRPKTKDRLISSTFIHKDDDSPCNEECKAHRVRRDSRQSNDPCVFYGPVASGDQLVRSPNFRDKMQRSCGALCFDMEACGVMDNNQYLVIRGIADYADSHKNKDWQPLAAATAAAYAKELILAMAPSTQQKRKDGGQESKTPTTTTIQGAQNQNNYGGQNVTGVNHVSFGGK